MTRRLDLVKRGKSLTQVSTPRLRGREFTVDVPRDFRAADGLKRARNGPTRRKAGRLLRKRKYVAPPSKRLTQYAPRMFSHAHPPCPAGVRG